MDIYIIPISTGFLAWFIAWLFVKIFTKSKRFGFEKMVHQFDISILLNKENSAQQFEAVLPIFDKQLDDFFKNKLGEKMPAIAMFIGEKTIAQLKVVFVDEIRAIFPSLIQNIAIHGKQDFEKKMDSKWMAIIEKRLMNASKPFRFLAFAIGLVFGILMVVLNHHL
jgi:hypothetical protein